MADLSITAASVLPVSGAAIDTSRNAGATITAGQTVYVASDNTWQLARNTTQALAGGSTGGNNVGIALNGASSGQPLHVLTQGDIDIGATVAVGGRYFVSDNLGGIAPTADVSTGEYVTFLAIGITAARLRVKPVVSGIAAA